MIGSPSPPIIVDDQTVAKIKKNSFFRINLPPGPHKFASKGFRTKKEELQIEVDIRPGQVYFVRVQAVIGSMKFWPHLRMTEADDALAAFSKLKPLDAGNIRDRARTSTAPPDRQLHGSDGPALRNEDIIALKQAGLGDDVILEKIRSSRAAYDLTPSGIAALKEAKISEPLLEAIRAIGGAAPVSPPQK